MHRIEHLGGDNHRLHFIAAHPNDPLLSDRCFCDVDLHAQVAPRHHHAIGRLDDRLQIIQRLPFLDFRYHQALRLEAAHQAPQRVDVRCRPHEAEADEVDAWKAWLVQEPLFESEELVVYRTDPQLGRDFLLTHELIPGPDGQPGIGLVQATTSPSQTVQDGTVQVSAVWASGSEIDQDYDLCLNLVDRDQVAPTVKVLTA